VRRRSRQLFDLLAGFVYSQVVLALTRLRIAPLLAAQPRSAAQLAELIEMPTDRLERLLQAACSLKLIERRSHDRYGIGALGAPLVSNGGITAMVEHHSLLYADLLDPVDLLKTPVPNTAMARYWPYASHEGAPQAGALTTAQVEAYSRLMAASQPLVAEQVLSAYDIDRHQKVLDVGGGEGAFVIEATQRTKRPEFILFDLPAVVPLARVRLTQAMCLDRVEVVGGSFFADPLPQGADLVTLVRVLFDHPDERALALLKAVRQALTPSGRVLIAEPVMALHTNDPVNGAYFNLYLLAMGHGRLRTLEQFQSLLSAAGFGPLTRHRSSLPLHTAVFSASPRRDT
jgi:demethylspheroidene O-methyltransferase